MRPLSAHCHLGLGHVCVRTHDQTRAQEHLTTAAAMYRQMGMGIWLEHQTYAPTMSSSSIG
jgi:hypothetical protein